jgi:hypothetical protein
MGHLCGRDLPILERSLRNSLLPLRAIYRQALALDEVAVNLTAGVELPAVRGKRSALPHLPRRRSSSPLCRSPTRRLGHRLIRGAALL